MGQPEPGVLLLDDRRVLVAANDLAAEILGTTREEVIGRRADDFMPMIARPLYPLAWRGFLVIGHASGDYAAQREDGTLAHLAYVGFANRPVRGLHFFVLEALPGEVGDRTLVPKMQTSHLQVGLELDDDIRARLVREADRQEGRLPIQRGSERTVLAALFDAPAAALDALDAVRSLGDASVATAAGATSDSARTLLAGHFPLELVGKVVESIRSRGGRVVTSLDERWI